MDYKSRLLQLKLLPLSMLYELNDISFFVKSLKNPHSSFNTLDFVKFSHNSTRIRIDSQIRPTSCQIYQA